jgi:hypothetical protein
MAIVFGGSNYVKKLQQSIALAHPFINPFKV